MAAECVKSRMPAVARALAGELTPMTLFLSLWAQQEGVVDYPLDDETAFSIGPVLAPPCPPAPARPPPFQSTHQDVLRNSVNPVRTR